MLLLSEFLDDNAHKCYPFSKLNELPTDFIVDAKFMVTGNIDKTSLYVSQIEFSETHIRVYMAVKQDNELLNIGRILTCPKPANRNTEYSCKLVNSELEIIVEGFITFGSLDNLPKNKNIITLAEDGNVFSGCVIPVTEWCTGIKVNDQIYTGVVTLQATDGIVFDVSETASNTLITMKYDGFQRPDNLTLDTMDDADILKKIIELWGTPITSISGVTPDEKGNITIDIDPESTNYISLTPGIATLTLDDTYIEKCGVTTNDMERMLTNISVLNERSGILETLTQQLETQVNTLSHEVSKIQG